MGEAQNRNEQFEIITALKAEFLAKGLPILSMDTKKKELLGCFYRKGKCLSKIPVQVADHDFPSFAEGRIIPHGIYDVGQNRGYLTLGGSHDTSAFACDNLLHFWQSDIQ